ncbi:LysR substrate-binding domain-containing protein [Vibrio europaeus]|uniref:LysR family transcriptional regulator n=1 Tax=Vibrio europaeus TaxID=300876 RepID=A0A178J3X7_9VIBR|nr:LysR substrate-binding domain-containing protein [Vibrio europaeus]MDC5706521.1 LysR substrate-binding domain-containing protein [Vibrio europaeus]MDC5711946.1 LysR substrate-binding domain-containing protein [Vibrio europaeus]MDC5716361.1 LysR substrate-binding domain-containing protein [Vibrio europaeus]MDC5721815.1 LysR substrate-binding domain-containing protein [Vibrio europaeus]MDC5725932.1 LysR substrate-binding domain-containing protein [Vibrio europaeus]
MITSEDLRFIATIATHRTLASAARTLNITPPSVTLRLQHIEKKLSVPILQRPSRVVSLTEEGQLLLKKGLTILRALDELQEQLDERKGQICGKLSVLAPLGFGNDYVAPLLGRYKQMHPTLDIELELSDHPEWSSHHKWDVIIYIGTLNNSSLRMVTLAANQRFICASPQYVQEMGRPETPFDLLQHRCIALRENNEDVALWPFTDMANDREQVIRINPSLASNEGRVIKEWALAGLGIIMRSEWDVQPQIDSGQLVRLLPDYALPDANIVALVGSAKQERSARIAGFLSLLKTQLSSVPWQPLNKDA